MLMHANELFLEAIARFPKSNSIRLAYALFSIEVMNNQSTALEELATVEMMAPSFEEQFLAYRYRRIIKESLLASKTDDSDRINISAVMAYESHYSLLKEKIEKTTILHVQFWGLLLDDAPDLSKLKTLGYRIEEYIDEIRLHWNRMQELEPDMAEALHTYSEFTEQVLNDRLTSRLLSDRAKQLGGQKQTVASRRKTQANNTSNLELLATEGDPCLCISGQQNKLGIVTKCNMALCRLFGYGMKELLGCSVNELMPELFGPSHQDALAKDLQLSTRGTAAETARRYRRVLGKTKAAFVVPLWLSVLSGPTLLNESNYVGILHPDKASADSSVMYFFVNRQRLVIEMSSSAILVCGLYPYMLRHVKLPFSTLCPELDLSNAPSKAEIKTVLYIPDLRAFDGWSCLRTKEKLGTTGSLMEQKSEETLAIKQSDQKLPAICQVEPVEIGGSGLVGYTVRVEVDEELKRIMPPQPAVAIPGFQFRFDVESNKFVRELARAKGTKQDSDASQLTRRSLTSRKGSFYHVKSTEGADKEAVGSSVLTAFNMTAKEIIREISENPASSGSPFFNALLPKIRQLTALMEHELDSESNKLLNENIASLLRKCQHDYGDEVVTYRLLGHELVEVRDNPLQALLMNRESQAEIVTDEVVESSKSGSEKKASFLIAGNIKGRQALKDVLGQGRPREIWWIAFGSYMLFSAVIALAVVNYVYLSSFFDTIHLRIQLIDLSYQRLVNEQAIMYNVATLLFLHEYDPRANPAT